MKFFPLPLFIFSLFSFRDIHLPANFHNSFIATDTSFKHITDGKSTEWPAQQFETDLSTGIKYSSDNDTQNLYLVLIVPNQRIQTKMMRNGTELYIDLRGKKKEGKGIEFPVRKDPAAATLANSIDQASQQDLEQETPEQRKASMKTMRAQMVLNLTSMKVFGFAGDQSDEQGLIMPGSANIAFAWDSTNAMCIEYKIPLSLIDPSSPLAKKDISIGWQVNGYQRPQGSSPEYHGGGGRHGGYGGRRNGGSDQNSNAPSKNFENITKDQTFWTKYTFK